MATWTDTEAHVARKAHVCDSCGETINAGDSYRRWRYFNDGASTIRMHPECLEMHISGAASVGECEFEFEPHAHERPSIGTAVHSANPVGAERMRKVIARAEPV